jgi:hypothetical protein
MTAVSEIRRPTPNASIRIRRLTSIPAETAMNFKTPTRIQCTPADKLRTIRLDYYQYILHQTIQPSIHQLQ